MDRSVGLAAHGVFHYFHAHIVGNPGVPEWWPAFCLAYDLGAAVSLAYILARAPKLTLRPSAG